MQRHLPFKFAVRGGSVWVKVCDNRRWWVAYASHAGIDPDEID